MCCILDPQFDLLSRFEMGNSRKLAVSVGFVLGIGGALLDCDFLPGDGTRAIFGFAFPMCKVYFDPGRKLPGLLNRHAIVPPERKR